jgi:hypothetical protein
MQRSELRLDTRDGVLKGGASGMAAILLGNHAESGLIQRVTSKDASYRMPFGRKALNAPAVAILKEWIDIGAPWPESLDLKDHWAFNKPEGMGIQTTGNPIDTFINFRLGIAELTANTEADKYTLVRRAYLELTGIPPTLEEVETFVADEKEDAYERLIDRLFDSPRYGEHQAVRWLDIARYADTNGYEKDRPRTMWPYRDWVINAFNENMPFDQFIIEQLAGDLLPSATESQRIATGFHRNAMLNEEGGIDAAEDRFKRTVDRTNTTGTALLGLTVSCAQCHNHKYDPISRKEYYQLFAYFNDTEETVFDISDEQTAHAQSKAYTTAAALNEKLLKNALDDEAFEKWKTDLSGKASRWEDVHLTGVSSMKGATLDILGDNSVLATGDVPNDDTYKIAFTSPISKPTAIQLEVLSHISLPGDGPGRGTILAEGDFLLTGVEIEYRREGETEFNPVSLAGATEDYAAENRSASQALDGKDDTGWSVKGETGKGHRAVFNIEQPSTLGNGSYIVTLHQDYIHQHTIGRFRITVTAKEHAEALPVPSEVETILVTPTRPPHSAETEPLKRYYALHVSPADAELRKKRDDALKNRPRFAQTLTMSPRFPPRETRMYNRGEFLSPRRKVEPGVPEILHYIDQRLPQNRLTLAKWLVSAENPLTARVLANQLWQQVFGRGIVETTEDFGVRGSPPSHPRLLDWLALSLVSSDWDMQALHRDMVTSATFKRSTAVTPEMLELDPNNIYLARGPRFRLTAEAIRDSALHSAGLLSDLIGGPSVFPPEPPGVEKLAYSKSSWPTSKGEARHRRSMYTYWKRTSPYATGMTFDMPTREEACVRRSRTNTPLQALTLLNDTVFTEIAQALGKRVLNHKGSVNEKIDFLFLSTISRYPDKVEQKTIRDFFKKQKNDLQKEAETARAIGGALSVLTTTDELPELAAWVAVSRIMLNLDEMIVRG